MTEDSARLKEGELVEERWEVQQLLGMGELAEVYDVVDRRTGGNAVVKLFAPQYLMAPGAWVAYQEYAEHIRALSLPALVNPFAFGIHPGSAAPFSVAERVGLPALDQLVATVGTLLPAQFARILRELAPLLDAMHRTGIVHRNLKPSNLFCGLQGSRGLQVSDTAVSALRRELSPYPGWGATPGWVAPEAVDPRAPDQVSMDVYAVGLLAFFALTDRNPFLSLTTFEPEQFLSELMQPLPRMSARAKDLGTRLDEKFDPWFERALAVDPRARFSSVGSMVNELVELTLPAPNLATVALPGPAWPINSDPALALQASIRPPALLVDPMLLVDPGVASVSVQPLLFSDQVPRSIPPSFANSAAMPPVTASPAVLSPYVAARRAANATKMVLLAALGTGVIAVLAAIIVTVVLMREREDVPRGEIAPRPSVSETRTPPVEATPEPPTPALEQASVRVPEPEPEPELGSVKFECAPEPCGALHCDGQEYSDPTQFIELAPGEHRCIGAAEGYLPQIASFKLGPKQRLVQTLELKKKGKPPAQRPKQVSRPARPATAPASPCGTFINPCK